MTKEEYSRKFDLIFCYLGLIGLWVFMLHVNKPAFYLKYGLLTAVMIPMMISFTQDQKQETQDTIYFFTFIAFWIIILFL